MGAILAIIIIAAVVVAAGAAAVVFVPLGDFAQDGDNNDNNNNNNDNGSGEPATVPASLNSSDGAETAKNVTTGTGGADDMPQYPINIEAGGGEIIEIKTAEQLADLVSRTLESHRSGMIPFRGSPEPAFFARDAAVDFDNAPQMESGAESAPDYKSVGASDVTDYSTTNVQVAGVDEPDFIKNDGQYAYVAIRNMLAIVDVWPAPEMHTVAKVALDIDPSHIRDIFLNGDTLVMLYASDGEDLLIPEYDFMPQRSYKPLTNVLVADIADRETPEIRADYTIDGWLKDARMIGDHVYVITSSSINHDRPELPIITGSGVDVIITPRAFYFDDEWQFSTFTTIAAIDIMSDTGDPESVTSETFLMGHTGTFYMTHSNLYLTYLQSLPPGYSPEQAARERFFNVIVPLLPGNIQDQIYNATQMHAQGAKYGDGATTPSIQDSKKEWGVIESILQVYYNGLDIAERDDIMERIREALLSYDSDVMREQTRTVIHKVSINESMIDYVAQGSVPGRLLNQFSLGESRDGERLRAATTLEYYTEFSGFSRSNGVYALDADMNMVGYIENVAPDESIYSARFMGDRLYMVTFQQIDPFFVIDISKDTPRILGELKIPGFSNYLHPYDDEHVLGIGRDTTLEEERWVRQLGIKVALFNVADVSNPVVADEVIIGDSSAYSDALNNHKAFFFDKRHGIMSLPVEGSYRSLEDTIAPPDSERNGMFDIDIFPDDYWRGFYIVDVDAEEGLDIRGTIAHPDFQSQYGGITSARTFYINDVLYTVSGTTLIASDIETLDTIDTERLVGTGALVDYLK